MLWYIANLLKKYFKRKGDKTGEKEKKKEIVNNKLALIYRNR
jgi:hypothetical protein